MKGPEILITGAGKGLGRETARSMKRYMPDAGLDLADIDPFTLREIGQELGVDPRELIAGDIFHQGSVVQKQIIESKAKILVCNAAQNNDLLPVEDRFSSRVGQTRYVIDHLLAIAEQQRQSKTPDARLVILVNSVLGVLDQIEQLRSRLQSVVVVKQVEYGPMKAEQFKIAEALRSLLDTLNVKLCILCPGALDTSFTGGPEDARKDYMQLIARTKPKDFEKAPLFAGRETIAQGELIQPDILGNAIGQVGKHFSDTGKIPTGWERRVILNNTMDMEVPVA